MRAHYSIYAEFLAHDMSLATMYHIFEYKHYEHFGGAPDVIDQVWMIWRVQDERGLFAVAVTTQF